MQRGSGYCGNLSDSRLSLARSLGHSLKANLLKSVGVLKSCVVSVTQHTRAECLSHCILLFHRAWSECGVFTVDQKRLFVQSQMFMLCIYAKLLFAFILTVTKNYFSFYSVSDNI